MSPPAGVAIRALSPADAEAVTVLFNLPGFRAGTLRLAPPPPLSPPAS